MKEEIFKKVKLDKNFITSLHTFIYDNSNALISISIDRECKEFVKKLKKCVFEK